MYRSRENPIVHADIHEKLDIFTIFGIELDRKYIILYNMYTILYYATIEETSEIGKQLT